MGNIIKATISIIGIRTALWHHFGPDAIPLEKQERTGVAGNDPEEWRKTVLMTKDRQLYFDPSYIFGCIRDASRHTRKGKGSIQSMMCATLQIVDERVLIEREGKPLYVPEEPIPLDHEEPVFMHVCGVRNPSSKARNVRYRIAASVGWQAQFSVLFDKTIISRNEMEAVLNDAGQLVGLADGRSMGFGRFSVESFNVVEG